MSTGLRAAAFIVAVVIAPAIAGAQGAPRVVDAPSVDAPVATAFTSARKVTLGRSFWLVIRVVHEPGITVNLPVKLEMPGIDELRRDSAEQVNADGSLTREFEVEVMAFTIGEITIAPLEITYTAQGELKTVRTNPIALEVIGVIGDGEESLRDISPPVDVQRDDYTLIIIASAILGGLLVLLVAILTWRRWWRRRVVAAARAAARVLPADEEALARLAELEASGDLDSTDMKQVYLTMSEIVKAYIGRRFGFPANELTTLEIRNELAARPTGDAAEALIRSWLESADLVKFANQAADSDDAQGALADARTFVEQTRRSAEPPPAPAPAPAPAPEPPTAEVEPDRAVGDDDA